MPYYGQNLHEEHDTDTIEIPTSEQSHQEKHVTFADASDPLSQTPKWKENGMAESREPNERYHGGAEDGVFGEGYSRGVPKQMSAAAGSGDGGDKKGDGSGSGAGGNSGVGGGPSNTTVLNYSSSTSTSAATSSGSSLQTNPARYGAVTTDTARVPAEISHESMRFNSKGQAVVVINHSRPNGSRRSTAKEERPPKKRDSK